jgi:hypothetical protein
MKPCVSDYNLPCSVPVSECGGFAQQQQLVIQVIEDIDVMISFVLVMR